MRYLELTLAIATWNWLCRDQAFAAIFKEFGPRPALGELRSLRARGVQC